MSVLRCVTQLLLFLSSFPPAQLLTSFCLTVKGLIFLLSSIRPYFGHCKYLPTCHAEAKKSASCINIVYELKLKLVECGGKQCRRAEDSQKSYCYVIHELSATDKQIGNRGVFKGLWLMPCLLNSYWAISSPNVTSYSGFNTHLALLPIQQLASAW